jgi:hypothetical protein
MKKEDLYKLIYSYPTKYKEGLLPSEVDALLTKNFPDLDREDYNKKLGCITVMKKEEGYITYHSDVFYAIIATLENRELNSFEVD